MRPPQQRGFTLAELMITVALVSVLALVCIASFRGHLSASKISEPAAAIEAIRAAEEAYRADNQRYLHISSSSTAWYPKADFSAKRYAWESAEGGSGYSDYAKWKLLGAAVTQPQTFRYLLHAGGAGSSFPNPLTVGIPLPASITSPRSEPWYLIQARADANENGTYCDIVATSLNNEMAIINTGE